MSHCGIPIYPCKRQHGDTGRSQRSHFHCPICKGTVTHRSPFVKHLENHDALQVQPEEGCRDENEDRVSSENHDEEPHDEGEQEVTGQEDEEDETYEVQSNNIDDETLKNCKSNRSNITKRACLICKKYMYPKSLARHCRNIHQLEVVSTAICVDEEGGLFLVRNSSHGGVGYPIHV